MTENTRQALNFGDLDDFDVVKPKTIEKERVEKKIQKTSEFPSRESSVEDQINIRASKKVLDRFRKMAKEERYKHGAFLEILMENYK